MLFVQVDCCAAMYVQLEEMLVQDVALPDVKLEQLVESEELHPSATAHV
jgi:hypothetical protein